MSIPWVVYPCKRLDVSLSDLAFAAAACLGGRERRRTVLEQKIRRQWLDTMPGEAHWEVMLTSSVRSGLDLLLTALKLPPGSEVLFSAVTIRHMVEICLLHELVPVVVDIDSDTLVPCPEQLRAAVTRRTRLVIVAHIFGAIVPIDELVAVVRQAGAEMGNDDIFFLEDCAQAYAGNEYRGSAKADAVAFSFGILKTATALGGSIWGLSRSSVAASMRALQVEYPCVSGAQFLRRILRCSAFFILGVPRIFGIFLRLAEATGMDLEAFMLSLTRGMPGSQLQAYIRRRPALAQLALLHRRLTHYDASTMARRRKLGADLAQMLAACPGARLPGRACRRHSYWLWPVLVQEPDAVCRALRRRGFDAQRGRMQLGTADRYLPAGQGDAVAEVADAHAMIEHIVYLPLALDWSERELKQLAAALHSATQTRDGA